MTQNDTPQDALSQRIRELELMVQVSRTLTSTLDVERLLKLIITMAAKLVSSEGASIILEDRRQGELVFRAVAGPKSKALVNIHVPIEGSIAGTVFKTQKPLIVQNTERDPRHYSAVDRDIQFDTQSILAVPMMFKHQVIGVLEAVNKLDNQGFDQHDLQILSTLAAQAAIAIENARLVSELQDANTRLAELDRLKSNFIAIASHELRTPLTLILGYASFLRQEADEAASKKLDMVLQGATQLQRLIEDMVNLNHLETGNVELDWSEFDLQTLIQEAIERQKQFALGRSLKIDMSMPPAPLGVRADREKIAIVLNNLLNNAIKFTLPGGRIQVTARPQTGAVAVSVIDTGIGIPAEELKHIFERFHQVASHLTRREGGMGLGLPIAQGIIELHGGRIWAESVPGEGSRFTFTLPALPPRNTTKRT